MVYGGWLSLVVISLVVSIAAFLWGFRTGQFSDQERARFLALNSDLPARPGPEGPPHGHRAKAAALAVVLAAGLAAFVTAVVMSVYLR